MIKLYVPAFNHTHTKIQTQPFFFTASLFTLYFTSIFIQQIFLRSCDGISCCPCLEGFSGETDTQPGVVQVLPWTLKDRQCSLGSKGSCLFLG